MSARMISTVSPNAISLQGLEDGLMHFALPDGQIIDQHGRLHARASLTARQAKAAGLLTSGTSGHILNGSSETKSAVLQQSLENRLQANLRNLGSTLYTLTWKPWATPSGVSRSRLRASAPRTSETGPTGWPTPKAQEDGRTLEQYAAARMRGYEARKGKTSGGPASAQGGLAIAVQLTGWGTPTCQSPNSLRGNGQDPAKRLAQGHTLNLTDEVNWLKDNPAPARLTACGEMLTGCSAGMESGGQLRPAHSRWLMGLPRAWDECAPKSSPKSRKK